MPYETGTASSPTDLLQKIGAFISSHGWTIDSSIAAGYWDGTGGPGWRLHAHRGSVYAHFRAVVNEAWENTSHIALNIVGFQGSPTYRWSGIGIVVGNGYNGANLWRDQPGVPVGCVNLLPVGAGMSLPQGAISWYHFFADATGDNIAIVIEKTAGIFTRMEWGTSLKKLGAWTGGAYFGAALGGYSMGYPPAGVNQPGFVYSACLPGVLNSSHYSAFCVQANVDAFSGHWAALWAAGGTEDGYGYTGQHIMTGSTYNINAGQYTPEYIELAKRLTSSMSGQSLFLPIRVFAERGLVASGEWSLIGTVPNIYASNACSKGFSPAGLYTWGSDQYRVFPGPTDAPHLGYAIKVV